MCYSTTHTHTKKDRPPSHALSNNLCSPKSHYETRFLQIRIHFVLKRYVTHVEFLNARYFSFERLIQYTLLLLLYFHLYHHTVNVHNICNVPLYRIRCMQRYSRINILHIILKTKSSKLYSFLTHNSLSISNNSI